MKILTFVISIFLLSALGTWIVLRPKMPLTTDNVAPTISKTFESHDISTIKSNKWYSSIYKSLPTSPIFSMPLANKFSEDGIGFSFPKLTIESKTIFAPYTEDFIVGLSEKIEKVQLIEVGDWHIKTSSQTTSGALMTSIIGRGLPYVHLTTNQQEWKIRTQDKFELLDQKKNSAILKAHENLYLLVWNDTGNIAGSQSEIIISSSDKLFVALLDKMDSRSQFEQIANLPVQATQTEWKILPTKIEATFNIGTDTPTLLALYPHQLATIVKKPEILGEYQTLRGKLSLIRAKSFTTQIDKLVPPEAYPVLIKPYEKLNTSLARDVEEFTKSAIPDSKSYGSSIWLGKAANLMALSDTLNAPDQKKALIAKVLPVIKDLKPWHEYDKAQTSTVSKKPEYGSERLNDHHFHYGYIIRIAAQIIKSDPSARTDIEPFITTLVEDIATTDRQSKSYPYIRNFDMYEGHSWADGYAQFEDGNNQESSSEAINAWYGVYLWAINTNNETLADTALYLFNAEIHSTKYYWFNVGDIYPTPYEHEIASLVWGGKIDYITWFGDVTNFKYGIQLLPLTPASIYLKDIPDFFKYEADIVRSGGGYKQPWGELLLAWKSYTSKDVKYADLPEVLETTPLSVIQYLIYSNTNTEF